VQYVAKGADMVFRTDIGMGAIIDPRQGKFRLKPDPDMVYSVFPSLLI
jgi:hypothetical protein